MGDSRSRQDWSSGSLTVEHVNLWVLILQKRGTHGCWRSKGVEREPRTGAERYWFLIATGGKRIERGRVTGQWTTQLLSAEIGGLPHELQLPLESLNPQYSHIPGKGVGNRGSLWSLQFKPSMIKFKVLLNRSSQGTLIQRNPVSSLMDLYHVLMN